ncbi:hypothetical protein ABZ379_45415 [Streptomyces canus]|uniref:hypothetical protein n=1 Tax=Streptomyces canus TaxID=58343 RepID=UPI0033FA44D6
MSVTPLSASQRAELSGLLGDAKPAQDALLRQLAQSVRDRGEHDHTTQREDLYCLNLTSFMGERMGPVLLRLLEAEAENVRLRTENDRLRTAVTDGVAAAVRSVHQRGHDVHLPLELLEFLTGDAESAAVAGPGALGRDEFQVVISRSGREHDVAEEILCSRCKTITAQAGFDGQGWTLARLDLLADRHRCLPRVTDDASVADEDIQECTCVEFCDEDPRTACSLSGRPHVHPAAQGDGFGPCPVHPNAPGDA